MIDIYLCRSETSVQCPVSPAGMIFMDIQLTLENKLFTHDERDIPDRR